MIKLLICSICVGFPVASLMVLYYLDQIERENGKKYSDQETAWAIAYFGSILSALIFGVGIWWV